MDNKPDTLYEIKSFTTDIVNARGMLKHEELLARLVTQFPSATMSELDLAVSEASQDGFVKRIEYQLIDSFQWRAFYLPAGTRLA